MNCAAFAVDKPNLAARAQEGQDPERPLRVQKFNVDGGEEVRLIAERPV